MIKFEKTEVVGWEPAIRGMRNPMNSWDKSDSGYCETHGPDHCLTCPYHYNCDASEGSIQTNYIIGPNDLDLMKRLRNAGTDHRKFMRMIIVYVDITAPLYWWKEFDTYKVGTVANSCSTMHKIHVKEFTIDDFSDNHLDGETIPLFEDGNLIYDDGSRGTYNCSAYDFLCIICDVLNKYRDLYLKTKDKKYWWQMIQLLPSSYNQKRTVMLNYEVLANIYKSRKNHKLDEWKEHDYLSKEDLSYENTFEKHAGFCDWIRTLPYSELITGKEGE